MARLISLVLQPVAESKRSSMALPQYPLPARSSTTTRSSRREHTTVVARLTILPFTKAEWRRVLEDVKVHFLRRQYKQCSARCVEVLDGIKIKPPNRVHPFFLIYLSFFAAISFEETARSLHQNSSSKLPALHQAFAYYKNAESLIDYANASADPVTSYLPLRSRQYSVSSSASSIRSYADSTFSHTSSPASTPSSGMSSPTLSYVSADDVSTHKHSLSSSIISADGVTPAPLRMKKKVSFSLQIDTLGANSTTCLEDDVLSLSPTLPDSPTLPPSQSNTVSSYLLIRSVARYRSCLAVLQVQLRGHIDSIDTQISGFNGVREARRSDSMNVFADYRTGLEGFDTEEMKKVDLRARVARLKERGWKRERFNGERYEKLCETALRELEGNKI